MFTVSLRTSRRHVTDAPYEILTQGNLPDILNWLVEHTTLPEQEAKFIGRFLPAARQMVFPCALGNLRIVRH